MFGHAPAPLDKLLLCKCWTAMLITEYHLMQTLNEWCIDTPSLLRTSASVSPPRPPCAALHADAAPPASSTVPRSASRTAAAPFSPFAGSAAPSRLAEDTGVRIECTAPLHKQSWLWQSLKNKAQVLLETDAFGAGNLGNNRTVIMIQMINAIMLPVRVTRIRPVSGLIIDPITFDNEL